LITKCNEISLASIRSPKEISHWPEAPLVSYNIHPVRGSAPKPFGNT